MAPLALTVVRGDVAEWLRSGLQSRLHRFDSGRRLRSKPLLRRGFLLGRANLSPQRVPSVSPKMASHGLGASVRQGSDDRACSTKRNPRGADNRALDSVRDASSEYVAQRIAECVVRLQHLVLESLDRLIKLGVEAFAYRDEVVVGGGVTFDTYSATCRNWPGSRTIMPLLESS
jgi:hypothetical protein